MSLPGSLVDAKCEQCHDRPPTRRVGPLGNVQHLDCLRGEGSVSQKHMHDHPEMVGVLVIELEKTG